MLPLAAYLYVAASSPPYILGLSSLHHAHDPLSPTANSSIISRLMYPALTLVLASSIWYGNCIPKYLINDTDQSVRQSWTAPIQVIICLILLLINMGPSALAGFSLFILMTPPQTRVMRQLFLMRKKSMFWTDKRVKLLQELLAGIRIIKFFAWEKSFLARVFSYRQKEMG